MQAATKDILKAAGAHRRQVLLTKRTPKARIKRYSSFGIHRNLPLTIVKEEVIAHDIYKGQLYPGI